MFNPQILRRSQAAKRPLRCSTGSFAVEVAVAVPLVFGGVLLPLLDLGCMGLRAQVMQLAARDGAAAGARAADAREARAKAESTARDSLAKFSGLKIKRVASRFVRVLVDDTTQQVRFTEPRSGEDPSGSVYQIEVEITGEVEPLIKFSDQFGKIAGLTTSSPCSGIAKAYFERPERLGAVADTSF